MGDGVPKVIRQCPPVHWGAAVSRTSAPLIQKRSSDCTVAAVACLLSLATVAHEMTKAAKYLSEWDHAAPAGTLFRVFPLARGRSVAT